MNGYLIDGRGRYLDNIFIEGLWRSLKQETIYLHELTDGYRAEKIIDDWVDFITQNVLTQRLINGRQIVHTSENNKHGKWHK